MTQVWPELTQEIVLGLDPYFNFMNYVDPQNPVPLRLSVDEKITIVFTLSDQLVAAGWSFQDRPFVVGSDYSINFSSYEWLENTFEGAVAPRTKFRIVFECARLGIFEYTLMFVDRHQQKIALDPKIENGVGK